ncbi:LysM peptidoglycan-binding domain-containing protein [Heliorestis convoluta]|uniref:LysM domain-containing protein n=1 Tax=Heliorestis convoluta TaxID=356322 RepID=A0A5Q2N239_9FIRM|nr:LysM peptidoglycan-binding domain-containing protein [Heliorestis convoluta]QGG47686.1 Putative LysM domain-containing protein [Heliorestis convoluta]
MREYVTKIMFGIIIIAFLAFIVAGTANANSLYNVKAGDSLWRIATNHGTTVQQIRELNGLTGDMILVGQSLKLPQPAYRVQSGDTLFRIAQHQGVTLVELIRANNLTNPNMLYVGQLINVPNQPTATPTQPTPTPQPVPTPTSQPDFAEQVANLVNVERAKAGLRPLRYDAELSKVALIKAQDMIQNNYFSHTSPTHGSPFDMMKSYGIRYTTAGENIARGQRTPQEVMTAWMNSSGHRANILNANFDTIGVGYYQGAWVQMFTRSVGH